MGPAPYLAGNVSEMACEVLRCGNPADSVLIVSPPGTPLMEAAVCQEHQSQIDQGDRWLYRYEEASGSRLLMGRDLPLRAVHVKVKSGFTCPGGMTRCWRTTKAARVTLSSSCRRRLPTASGGYSAGAGRSPVLHRPLMSLDRTNRLPRPGAALHSRHGASPRVPCRRPGTCSRPWHPPDGGRGHLREGWHLAGLSAPEPGEASSQVIARQ
jgi:hypothetical protein